MVVESERTRRLLLAEGTDRQHVLEALVKANVRLERFERVLAPMEDIFIRVVSGTGAQA